MKLLKNNTYIYLLLAVTIYLSFFHGIGKAPLFDEDEGAFSEATREMLRSGDFITPHLNGEPRYDKPILTYWLMAASAKLFGLNEFAMRFPSALAASFWVFSVFWFVSVFFDKKTAFWSSFMLATSLHISIIGKAATADALLNVFLANSMFHLSIWLLKQQKRNIYFSYIFTALAFLTKGPVAILIPVTVALIYGIIFRKQQKLIFIMLFNPIGLFLFSSIALPWYIVEYLRMREGFIQGFFLMHNINRFAAPMENHAGSFLYYIPVVFVATLPFSQLIVYALGRIKTYFKNNLEGFLFLWFAFVFVFFSLSGTKLPHYTIYGYTPLFILMSSYFIGNKKLRFSLFPMIILMVLVIIGVAFSPRIIDLINDKNVKLLYAPLNSRSLLYFSIALSLLAIVLSILEWKLKDNNFKLLFAGLFMAVFLNIIILPPINKILQEPVKEAALLAKENNYDIVLWKTLSPSFIFYYQGFVQKRDIKKGDIVFTMVRHLDKIPIKEILYTKHGYALIKVL